MITALKDIKWGRARKFRRLADGGTVKAVEMEEAFDIVLPSDWKKVNVERVEMVKVREKNRNVMRPKKIVATGKREKEEGNGCMVRRGGRLRGKKGDWIIRDAKGNVFACMALDPRSPIKPIFATKYEPAASRPKRKPKPAKPAKEPKK